MMVRFFSRAAIAAALMVFATGCVVARSEYQSCDPTTDACAGTTTCASANLTASASGVAGTFCTNACQVSTDCPPDPSGNPVSCAIVGTSGVCYRECDLSGTCPYGQTCSNVSGLLLCVPGGSSPATCGASGQTCCTGSTPCDTGLSCGVNGICGVACGGNGQACCGGSAPCSTGLSCGSNNTCGLAPYVGCSASSIGASCFAGVNAAGQTVATTCEMPTIANPGPQGFCTAGCVSSATECPEDIGGAAVGCFQLQGTSSSLCFVQCTSDAGCPASTVCRQLPLENGALVQVCLPPTA